MAFKCDANGGCVVCLAPFFIINCIVITVDFIYGIIEMPQETLITTFLLTFEHFAIVGIYMIKKRFES